MKCPKCGSEILIFGNEWECAKCGNYGSFLSPYRDDDEQEEAAEEHSEKTEQ